MTSYIPQVGDDLTFRFHYVNSGASATGLTVTVAAIYKPDGTTVSGVSGAAVTERGNGIYEYTLAGANVDQAGEYTAVVTTAGTVDQADLAAQRIVESRYTDARAAKIDNLDAAVSSRASAADYTATRAAKLDNLDAPVSGIAAAVWSFATRTLTSASSIASEIASSVAQLMRATVVTLRSPLVTESRIDVRVGDAYLAQYGRSFDWVLPVSSHGDLTGGTVELAIDGNIIGTGSIVDGGLETQTARVEMTSADTQDAALSALVGQRVDFLVRVTVGGNPMTEISGECNVLKAFGAQ